MNRINNAWICTVSNNSVKPIFGDLIIGKGKIQEIYKKKFSDYINEVNVKNENSYDAAGKVITISNVNFHEHIYSRLAKGLSIKGETESFENILENIWWKLDSLLDHQMIKSSVELAAIESIKNGVTYLFDHHSSPNYTLGSLNVISETLKEFNLRGVLALETSDRNGQIISDNCFSENEKNLLHNSDSEIKYLFGLHASFTLNDETLKKLQELVLENEFGIHIHLCEDEADRNISKSKFGDFPLNRLVKFNLLNKKSILSHAIHLTKSEYEKIAKLGIAIALNPDSNLNNSVGINNFNNLSNEQIILCGTDGMHANPAKTLKNLYLLMKHSKLSTELAFSRIIKIYFDQINFVKQFFPEYSLINKGENADFIIWDYVPPTPISKDNFWGHYIFGILESQVSSTIRDGKFLMKDKRLISIDESDIHKNIYKNGERLFNKFKKQ